MTGELLPPEGTPRPPSARGLRLNTLTAVQRELRRVYVDMRTRKIPSSEGTRLAFVLVQLAELHRLVDIEARLVALESAAGTDGHGHG